jgi:hypothetical protein
MTEPGERSRPDPAHWRGEEKVRNAKGTHEPCTVALEKRDNKKAKQKRTATCSIVQPSRSFSFNCSSAIECQQCQQGYMMISLSYWAGQGKGGPTVTEAKGRVR